MSADNQWPTVLPHLKSALNNAVNLGTTGKSPNKLIYGFRPREILGLLDDHLQTNIPSACKAARIDAQDAIAFATMQGKYHYNKKHLLMFMKAGDWVSIRLHRGYGLPGQKQPRTSQQLVGPFQITERVGHLAYQLGIPSSWRIHPVLSIAQLEPALPPRSDPYNRLRPADPPSVEVASGKDDHFEIKRITQKRSTRRGRGVSTEYLVRWKGYGTEHATWINVSKLQDATDVIDEFKRTRVQ